MSFPLSNRHRRHAGAPYTRRQVLGAGAGLLAGTTLRHRTTWAQAQPDPSAIEATLAAMSQAERIAQLFTVPISGTALTVAETTWLHELRPGGVILVEANIGTAPELRALIDAIHATNPDLPPLVAVDQEGGPVTRLFSDPVPGPAVLATLPDAEVRELAAERGWFLADFGFAVNYAPVADVAYTPDSFMADRSFGSDPGLVAATVAAVVEGTNATPVRATAKHFPGHGRTPVDSHAALPEVDLTFEAWWETDALPFRAAVAAGVPQIMLGHLSYPAWDDLPMSLSPVAVSVLRDDLGFSGAIVSDDLGMAALAAYAPADVARLALLAGLDSLLYVTPAVPITDLTAAVAGFVNDGTITAARIDDSVRRLLALRG